MSGASYSEQEAQARPGGTLAGWSVSDGHLRRHFSTDGWRASMPVVEGIGHLAELTWRHPDLHISWGGVHIAWRAHSEDAVTDRDLALVEVIERRAGRRPPADSVLDGTPREGGWRYLNRD